MKNHQLKALVQVAESGSIRAAARTMNLCQSALTKSLRELEEELGVELMTRSYKGIEFTDAGQTLLTRARLALALLDQAQDEIALQRGGAGVRVSIAVTPLVGIRVLPQVLVEFERNQPAARINLSEGFLSTLIPQLIDGRLDFAVALADPANLPYEIAFEPIGPVASAVAGRRNHPLAGARTWEALHSAKWVLNLSAGSQGSGFTHILDDPFLVVLFFDLRGELNGGHGLAHVSAVIILERGFVHHHQCVNFAQMQMCIDEGFCNQVAACIQFLSGLFSYSSGDPGDTAVLDRDISVCF